MRITQLQIRNYESFGESSGPMNSYGLHTLLVGKNNASKSNILSALGLSLGGKNPNYTKLSEKPTLRCVEIRLGPIHRPRSRTSPYHMKLQFAPKYIGELISNRVGAGGASTHPR